MSDTIVEMRDDAPVSLYLDLQPGQKVDLEVAARAALAFAAAIRETAYIFDPSMTVRVELLSGTDGSLSLNSLIRSIKLRDLVTRKRLVAVAITAALWFTHETGRWTFDEVLHYIAGTQYAAHLSPDDINEIVGRVTEALEKRTAQPHVGQVYRELETDTAVRGVGATDRPGTRPDRIVPRSEFAQRSGGAPEVVETSEIVRQTRRSHERVTVIRPVLESGKGSWQFASSAGRFFAPIRDRRFLDDLLTGRLAVPMVAGIQMDIDLDTTQEKNGDVWEVLNRAVIAVHRIHQPPTQESLPLAPPRADQGGSDDRRGDDEC